VCAFVVLRDPSGTLGAADVAEFCRGRLAHFKTPRHVHVVDGFPMTVSGKVRKNELRERAARALQG
jgi:fatty-acyl-CoA synthase